MKTVNIVYSHPGRQVATKTNLCGLNTQVDLDLKATPLPTGQVISSLWSLWEVNYAYVYIDLWASLVSQMVKNLQAMQENKVQALGWEDPLEKRMSTHSSILARRIAWTEEPGRLQSMELQRVWHNLATEQQQQCIDLTGQHRWNFKPDVGLILRISHSICHKWETNVKVDHYNLN